ncbi:MAG: glycosyltransferase family 4 protein, partial [Planctomycetota bacterium]|nr:glycosyltransferase family 4 protein [Planctomycetota bacterium]
DDAPPYAVVPRGVSISDAPPPTPDPETVRVLLPAGIRRVKDVIGAVRLAEALRAAGVPLTLCIAGPVLDGEYARSFEATLASMGHPHFIRWRRAVPRTGMPALYDQADVVWNTSLHEGGPNALLEGLAHGCAVMARDVDGVRDLFVTPDAPGHLVSWDAGLPDIDALAAWHEAVRQESMEERTARTETARAWLRANHDSHAEVEALRAAYELALSAS